MRGQVGHLKPMSCKPFSPETPDLFSALPLPARRRSGPARPSSGSPRPTPKLSNMSDGELALLLSDVVREVQRRTAAVTGRKPSPDLDRATREAAAAFAGPAPSGPKMPRRGLVKDNGEVPETKRKVIQAALRAGVKPTQVAKHFGVSLVALRQIGSAAE
jgi:hypothetical protein